MKSMRAFVLSVGVNAEALCAPQDTSGRLLMEHAVLDLLTQSPQLELIGRRFGRAELIHQVCKRVMISGQSNGCVVPYIRMVCDRECAGEQKIAKDDNADDASRLTLQWLTRRIKQLVEGHTLPNATLPGIAKIAARDFSANVWAENVLQDGLPQAVEGAFAMGAEQWAAAILKRADDLTQGRKRGWFHMGATAFMRGLDERLSAEFGSACRDMDKCDVSFSRIADWIAAVNQTDAYPTVWLTLSGRRAVNVLAKQSLSSEELERVAPLLEAHEDWEDCACRAWSRPVKRAAHGKGRLPGRDLCDDAIGHLKMHGLYLGGSGSGATLHGDNDPGVLPIVYFQLMGRKRWVLCPFKRPAQGRIDLMQVERLVKLLCVRDCDEGRCCNNGRGDDNTCEGFNRGDLAAIHARAGWSDGEGRRGPHFKALCTAKMEALLATPPETLDNAGESQCFATTQHPGDLLLIPVGWWHTTENLDGMTLSFGGASAVSADGDGGHRAAATRLALDTIARMEPSFAEHFGVTGAQASATVSHGGPHGIAPFEVKEGTKKWLQAMHLDSCEALTACTRERRLDRWLAGRNLDTARKTSEL